MQNIEYLFITFILLNYLYFQLICNLKLTKSPETHILIELGIILNFFNFIFLIKIFIFALYILNHPMVKITLNKHVFLEKKKPKKQQPQNKQKLI